MYVHKNISVTDGEWQAWKKDALALGISVAGLIRKRMNLQHKITEPPPDEAVPLPSLLKDMRWVRERPEHKDESEGIKNVRVMMKSSPRVFLDKMVSLEQDYLAAVRKVEEAKVRPAVVVAPPAAVAQEEAGDGRLEDTVDRFLREAGV